MSIIKVDPVILRKSQIMERCILRIREEMIGSGSFETINQTKQDAVLLNLERACQAAIDLAMRIVRVRKLGLPTDARDGFRLIHQAGLLDEALYKHMVSMVGFRNTAVHDYQGLNLKIVDQVIQHYLDHFLEFSRFALRLK
jgi:uncharacterized protein YutE (UPF0331/DUF86 family)